MPHDEDAPPEEPMRETMGPRDVKKATRPKTTPGQMEEETEAEPEFGFARPPPRSRTGDFQ